MADTLCDKFLQVGVDKDAIDEAFIGAFHGFAHRMLTIFNEDFVHDIVAEMAELVESEQSEPHVCADCAEKHGLAPVSTISNEDRKKMH